MSEDPKITGSLSVSSGDQAYNFPALPIPIIEALHKTVLGAQDSIDLYRRRASKVTPNDVAQLDHLVAQWCEPYAPISVTSNIIVSHKSSDEYKGRVRSRHKSVDSFLKIEPAKTEETLSLAVNFSALLRNSETGKLDQIEITVDLIGKTRQYMFDFGEKGGPLGGGWSFGRGRRPDDEDVTLRISTKYSNYLVARGIISIVDIWYSNLDEAELYGRPGRLKFLWFYDQYDIFSFAAYVVKFLPILVTLTMLNGVYSLSGSIWPPESLVLLGAIGFFLLAATEGTLRYAFQRLRDQMEAADIPLLEISSGDTKRIRQHERDVAERRKKYGFLVNVVGAGVIISILSSALINLAAYLL